MALAVKTDGAAVASGAIADALIRAKALAATGIACPAGSIMGVSTTVKVFIDIFISRGLGFCSGLGLVRQN